MIPLSVRVILYGIETNVPKGGFPTKGYMSIMNELMKIKNSFTIFPKDTYSEVFEYFYWSQKSRWAFKRLLLFWNDRRFKNKYGNQEDLYGNTFDEYEEPVLTLWDWRSSRYYRFGYTELIEHGYSKLSNYHYPTNPYINMPFTYCQCIRIRRFLREHNTITDTSFDKKSIVYKYSRFPENMFLNTQHLMERNGFPKIQNHIQCGPSTLAEEILLDEIVEGIGKTKNDKKILSGEMRETLYKLIVNERNDVSYVPDTKYEKQMFEIFVKYGLDETINWYNEWLYKNRKVIKINESKIRGPFHDIVMRNI